METVIIFGIPSRVGELFEEFSQLKIEFRVI